LQDMERIKIIVVGDGAVGKTSIVSQFAESRFSEEYKLTVGATFASKTVEVEGKKVRLSIWDLAGQPRFDEITQMFFKGARGVAYVFDLQKPATLKNLTNWYKRVTKETGNIPAVLVGNKLDLAPESIDDVDAYAKQFAQYLQTVYIKSSAKQNINIDVIFKELVSRIFRTKDVKIVH